MGSYLTSTDRVGAVLRMVFPYAFLLLLFFLNAVSIPTPVSVVFKAPFFLMALYYWSVYRPTFMPAFLVCVAGLVLDFLEGIPVGANALLFLLCRIIVVDQRRYLVSQTFSMVWLGFVFLNIIFVCLKWMIFSLVYFRWASMPEIPSSVFFGMAFFPLIYLLLHMVHKMMPAPSLKGKPL